MLQFWNILLSGWKNTSDNLKFIVQRQDILSLRFKYLRGVRSYREGDHLCTQMKLIYTDHIQHPMHGITGREQD